MMLLLALTIHLSAAPVASGTPFALFNHHGVEGYECTNGRAIHAKLRGTTVYAYCPSPRGAVRVHVPRETV